MAEERGEKTEEPTSHKLSEARKRGEVFKSKELTLALEFIFVIAYLAASAWAVRLIHHNTIFFYSRIADVPFYRRDVWPMVLTDLSLYGKIIVPLFGVAFISAFIFTVAQTGFLFSAKPINPNLKRINPSDGFKRIFSRQTSIEFFKQVLKVVIIGTVAWKVTKASLPFFPKTVLWDLKTTLAFGKALMFRVLWGVTACFLVIGIIDYLLQRKLYIMKMRMSVQELKEEFKETEGSPQIKSRVRQLQRQMVERSMIKEVPQATAVITNPTHLAVALRYELGKMEAPLVVAKGERLMAERIKEIAQEHAVPVLENVGLARALFEACKVGDSIPGNLYKATAEVLAFVYRLKRRHELARRRAILRIRGAR